MSITGEWHEVDKFDFRDPVKTISLRYRETFPYLWKNTCWYCGCILGNKTRSLDHVVPRSICRSDAIENIVYACKRCNLRKANSSLEEYRGMEGVNLFWGEIIEEGLQADGKI